MVVFSRIYFYALVILIPSISNAQGFIGVGASAMYNFQTQGIGVGIRGQFPLVKNLSIVPQLYYFPGFNKINELFVGANLHYDWRRWQNFTPYVLAGGFYNRWLNAETSGYLKAKPNNFIPELGVGILFRSFCWRPFIEQRYNPVWKEGTFRIGIMYYPKSCSGKGSNGTNRKTYACPKINK
jgi:hypothetical protein